MSRVMLLHDLKTVDGLPMPDPDPAGPTTPHDDAPTVVKAISPFDHPVIAGEFVFHCHIIPPRGAGHDGEHLRR